jgi:trehalose/maltose hydrolase-like predicted phosphorylase
VRRGLYGLLSNIRQGADDSISPVGLTSDNYAGLIFWDAETWMYPALLLTHPEIAKSIVEYRYRTMPARGQRAAAGLPGPVLSVEQRQQR